MSFKRQDVGVFSFAAVLVVLGLILAGVYAYLGWAIMVMWNWFVVPLGVAELSIAHAVGLSMLWSLFALRLRYDLTKSSRPKKEKYTAMSAYLVSPAVTVFFGWIVQNWFL